MKGMKDLKGFSVWAAAVMGVVTVSATLAAQSYVPHRVFNTATGAFSDFESMAAVLAKADVVFVGEQHDDPNTHRLELAVLESLARRGRRAVVSLEMFERDAQEPLEHFLMGHTDEAEFLKASRPWPRYATDYKPLVDFAVSREWPVVAANVPRPIASEVAKGGLDVLKQKVRVRPPAVRRRPQMCARGRDISGGFRRGDGQPSGARRLRR